MRVVDERLALLALSGDWPDGLPDDVLGLPVTRHWRLLQRIHAPGTGQVSQVLARLAEADIAALRHPDPEILQVLDPRLLLDDAAIIAARYGRTGLLIAETIAAGVAYGQALWFGDARNGQGRLGEIADDIGIAVHVISGPGA